MAHEPSREAVESWRSGQRRARLTLGIAVALPLLLLAATVWAGLTGLETRRFPVPAALLDANIARGIDGPEIQPLSPAYVDHVLGRPQSPSPVEPAGSTGSPAGAGSEAVGSVQAAEQRRPQSVAVPAGSNDGFSQAVAVGHLPFTATTNTRGTSRQTGEPRSCSAVGGTVWFRFRAPVGARLTVSTFGSSYQALTGVFTGTTLSGLSPIRCVREIGTFSTQPGTTYYFQVGGAGRLLVFHLVPAVGVVSIARASVANDGHQAIFGSDGEAVARNGRYVTFNTGDETLAGGSQAHNALALLGYKPTETCSTAGTPHLDNNFWQPTHTDVRPDCQAIYVRDRHTGVTEFVDYGYQESLSASGRFVVYARSVAHYVNQIFVFDRQTGRRRLVSHTAGYDIRSDAQAWHPVISGNGRYVAYVSNSDDLVRHDTNGRAWDVFLWDARTNHNRVLDTSSTGRQSDGPVLADSWETGMAECLSYDGHWAVFASNQPGLNSAAPPGLWTTYRKNLRTGRLDLVSVAADGGRANGDSMAPGHLPGHCITDNGRFVVFPSYASNLVPRDTNRTVDYFVRDMRRGVTEQVDVSSTGRPAGRPPTSAAGCPPGSSVVGCGAEYTDFGCSITPEGRYVAFSSGASNLVPRDTNGFVDIFRHDRLTGETVRASVPVDAPVPDPSGVLEQGVGGDSIGGDLSGDGRVTAFHSQAGNLVSGDTNDAGDIFAARFNGTTALRSLGTTTRTTPAAVGPKRRQSTSVPATRPALGAVPAGGSPATHAGARNFSAAPRLLLGALPSVQGHPSAPGGSAAPSWVVLALALPVVLFAVLWAASRRAEPAVAATR